MCLETEVAGKELFYIHAVAVSWVVGRLVVGDGVPLTLWFVPGTLFLLLGYLVQLQCEGFCLLLLYFVFLVWLLSLEGSFLMGDRGRVDLEERGTGRSWEEQRKESVLLPSLLHYIHRSGSQEDRWSDS